MTDDKPLILIVDDTPANIQVLADALRDDYRVKVATNGPTALEIANRDGGPDLVLLDVMMPDMDGYEVIRRLKASDVTRNVPVIFITAKSDPGDEAQGFDLGAVDYIVKPFHMPIVRARVRTHVDLKRNNDLLESLARLDGLTRVPNHRSFQETLQLEWLRARRHGWPLAIVMADVDCFKQYNDSCGHAAGDECLRQIASLLSGAIRRPADFLARYGGEEFIALLPHTDREGAIASAERMRQAVEAAAIPHPCSTAAPVVTVSFGVASDTPTDDRSPAALVDVADRALYRAKREGRNRVSGSPTASLS
jgi:diguanylate cyclase (GGDEF)-like protein